MRTGRLFACVAATVVAVCFLGTYALSQDKPASGQPANGMDEKMMQAWMEASTPGPHHQALAAMAGNFKYVNKWRMDPKQEWATAEGDYEGEMGLDGRFLFCTVRGPMMGSQFVGMGALGYDNAAKKHVAAWLDNMGTGILRSEGTCDGSCKTITFEGEMLCPMEHTMKPYKYQYEVKSNDEFTMRWWSPSMSDGQMFESMVITYTRVK